MWYDVHHLKMIISKRPLNVYTYTLFSLPWPLPEVSIRGAGQKDRRSGDENAFSTDESKKVTR